MKESHDPVVHEMVLKEIRHRAKAGQRAPLNDEIPSGSMTIRQMVKRGLIRTEVYAHNYRVIEIVGEGLRTAERPGGGQPYKVCTKDGTIIYD